MTPLSLSLEISCTRDEAARFVALEVFLDEVQTNPGAEPPSELDAVFGTNARAAILQLSGHPEPLGFTSRYDDIRAVLVFSTAEGRPNLAALPVLLLWLYPDKLPLAYSVSPMDSPDLAVWTIVGLSRIEITQDEAEVASRLAAMRTSGPASRRIDLLPTKPLPGSDH